jgi:hypothetical protein
MAAIFAHYPKTYLMNFNKSDVPWVYGFLPNSPTQALGEVGWLRRSVSTKTLEFWWKRHPQNVGADTRPPETRNGRIEATSWNYHPPLAPINRELFTVTNFHRSLDFLRTFACDFAERFFTTKGLKIQEFVNFRRYYFPVVLIFLSTFKFMNFVLHIFTCEKSS